MPVINKFSVLVCFLVCVLFAQSRPLQTIDNELFDSSIFNSSIFESNEMNFPKKYDIPDIPKIDQGMLDDLNKYNEDLKNSFAENTFNQQTQVEYETRPAVASWFLLRMFIGLLFVLNICCIICCRKCCKKRTIGIIHRESVLVVVTPNRNQEEQQQTLDPNATAPPPSYEEAVIIPPLPTAEELKAKRQQDNQSEA